MTKEKHYFKLVLALFAAVFILSACSEKTSFKKGDIKDSFCGVGINASYCKCAFHNKYCDSINMSKREAKKYVNEQYDNWVEDRFDSYKDNCRAGNGIIKGKSCIQCDLDEVSRNDKCVKRDDVDSTEDEDADDNDDNDEGECKYDSDCDPICEESVMWKMGCNARTDTCEKTFDNDCNADTENFGELSFPKICQAGACIRDENSIKVARDKLIAEKKLWSDTVKEINAVRDGIRDAMLDANKNCINGIADMTNVAIMEFSTRIASVLAGGIPDVAAMTASAAETASGLIGEHVKNLAGAAVDYAGEGLNRLYNYQSGEPALEEQKLKPHEYIKLNCDLYDYFKGVQAESDVDLRQALDNANAADQAINLLP
ncbi:hypothetical protein KAJ89_00155 [Candidatus Parcubacteria bacterium]|nr:hypothetical protein [Candidatus Parcubacteria bacterium]